MNSISILRAGAAVLLGLALAGPASANLVIEYTGQPLDQPYLNNSTPPTPQSPGVGVITIRIELPVDSLPVSAKLAFNNEYGTGYQWASLNTPNAWQRGTTLRLEVSDGVRSLGFADRTARIQLGITTNEQGDIVAWGMSARQQLPPPGMLQMSSSNRDTSRMCPDKFIDWTTQDGQLLKTPGGTRYQSYASKSCTPGRWVVKARE